MFNNFFFLKKASTHTFFLNKHNHKILFYVFLNKHNHKILFYVFFLIFFLFVSLNNDRGPKMELDF